MKQRVPLFLTLVLSIVLFSQCATLKNKKLTASNKETVRVWFEEGWNHNRNEELLERCFDPAWRDGNPLRANQISGYEGMRQLIKSYRAAAPDAHFTITHLFADKNQVAVRYEVVATQTGPMFGIPATGRQFTSTGIVIYDMKDGRIEISWQELDLTGILNQLKD
jgi:predicted ester cyclase